MKATSRHAGGKLQQQVQIRSHEITADEPRSSGGEDSGPSPQELLAASLASCTAVTIQMYAERKGWEIDDLTVDVDDEPAQRGSLTRFSMTVGLPRSCPRRLASA